MRSTEQGYTPGWAPRSTGPLAAMPWGIDLLSKGRVMAGALIGDIQADAGSIGTAELATSAVTTVKIRALNVTTAKIAAAAVTQAKVASLAIDTTSIAGAAVTDAKRSFGWSTLTGTLAGVGSLPSVLGGYLLTNPGTTKGIVFTTTGTRFSIPTPGDSYRFNVDSTPGTTRGTFIQSTAATFDGTNKNLRFGENDQFAVIEAVSATRWAVTSWSTGVSIAATT